jgi:hypothetical protein
MRSRLSVTFSTLMALIAGAAVMLWSGASFAGTPTLGPDCGTGAALVGTSSDSAGKVTLGAGAAGTCTLIFGVPYTNAPACTASNETNGGGYSTPLGTKTTATALVLGGLYPWVAGDVISYSCQGY